MKELLQDNYDIKEYKYISLKKMLDKETIENNLIVPLGVEEDKYHYIGFEDIPCLLVTGETGSGKSNFLDCIIISLILKNNSNDIKFIMMDPKKIELNYYNNLDYMMNNTLNDSNESILGLQKIYKEYKNRLIKLKKTSIRDYNKNTQNKIPHLFIIIDESCDLMNEKENLKLLKYMIDDCDKLGLHFIIATNTPYEGYFDKEFINKIKYKITFDLTSKAEASWIGIRNSQLLPTPGDAIISGDNKRIQIKTPYISDEDIKKIINYLK